MTETAQYTNDEIKKISTQVENMTTHIISELKKNQDAYTIQTPIKCELLSESEEESLKYTLIDLITIDAKRYGYMFAKIPELSKLAQKMILQYKQILENTLQNKANDLTIELSFSRRNIIISDMILSSELNNQHPFGIEDIEKRIGITVSQLNTATNKIKENLKNKNHILSIKNDKDARIEAWYELQKLYPSVGNFTSFDSFFENSVLYEIKCQKEFKENLEQFLSYKKQITLNQSAIEKFFTKFTSQFDMLSFYKKVAENSDNGNLIPNDVSQVISMYISEELMLEKAYQHFKQTFSGCNLSMTKLITEFEPYSKEDAQLIEKNKNKIISKLKTDLIDVEISGGIIRLTPTIVNKLNNTSGKSVFDAFSKNKNTDNYSKFGLGLEPFILDSNVSFLGRVPLKDSLLELNGKGLINEYKETLLNAKQQIKDIIQGMSHAELQFNDAQKHISSLKRGLYVEDENGNEKQIQLGIILK